MEEGFENWVVVFDEGEGVIDFLTVKARFEFRETFPALGLYWKTRVVEAFEVEGGAVVLLSYFDSFPDEKIVGSKVVSLLGDAGVEVINHIVVDDIPDDGDGERSEI